MSDSTRLAQEWLCLHGYDVEIDGIYGPATRAALTRFQTRRGLKPDGVLNPSTLAGLEAPLRSIVEEVPDQLRAANLVLDSAIVILATRILRAGAREVGGPNRGPWVRLFMEGRDGPEWSWCIGLCHYVVAEAARAIRLPVPILDVFPGYTSCDAVARHARLAGRLYTNGSPEPGNVMLVRRTSDDWIHAGIVADVDDGAKTFTTIEGNASATDPRNGDRVIRKTRALTGRYDFIRTS